jgi:phosphatidylglycerol---prolipoprotein diacylglyceryl transferase
LPLSAGGTDPRFRGNHGRVADAADTTRTLIVRPVLLEWRGIRVPSYPALLYLGTVCGVFCARSLAERTALDPARVVVAMLLLFPVALVGARLLFVAYHWRFFRRRRSRILRRVDSGASVYGGLLLAVPASVPLLAALGLGFGAFWDLASLAMLIGLTFTKVGCLLNGCCSGRETAGPLGLVLADHTGTRRRRIPAQLLEAGVALALAVGVIVFWDQRAFPGAILLCAVAGYSLARIGLEATRETVDRVAGVSVNQAVSVVLAVLSLLAFAMVWLGDSHGLA